MFELLYEGFIGTAKPATREEHAAVKGILRKLRKMSKETDKVIPFYNPEDKLAPRRRELTPGYDLFDDGEWQYLTKTVGQLSTPAVLSETVMDLFDKLDQAPKGDAKELMTEVPAEVQQTA